MGACHSEIDESTLKWRSPPDVEHPPLQHHATRLTAGASVDKQRQSSGAAKKPVVFKNAGSSKRSGLRGGNRRRTPKEVYGDFVTGSQHSFITPRDVKHVRRTKIVENSPAVLAPPPPAAAAEGRSGGGGGESENADEPLSPTTPLPRVHATLAPLAAMAEGGARETPRPSDGSSADHVDMPVDVSRSASGKSASQRKLDDETPNSRSEKNCPTTPVDVYSDDDATTLISIARGVDSHNTMPPPGSTPLPSTAAPGSEDPTPERDARTDGGAPLEDEFRLMAESFCSPLRAAAQSRGPMMPMQFDDGPQNVDSDMHRLTFPGEETPLAASGGTVNLACATPGTHAAVNPEVSGISGLPTDPLARELSEISSGSPATRARGSGIASRMHSYQSDVDRIYRAPPVTTSTHFAHRQTGIGKSPFRKRVNLFEMWKDAQPQQGHCIVTTTRPRGNIEDVPRQPRDSHDISATSRHTYKQRYERALTGGARPASPRTRHVMSPREPCSPQPLKPTRLEFESDKENAPTNPNQNRVCLSFPSLPATPPRSGCTVNKACSPPARPQNPHSDHLDDKERPGVQSFAAHSDEDCDWLSKLQEHHSSAAGSAVDGQA